jgi:hypothetical protein
MKTTAIKRTHISAMLALCMLGLVSNVQAQSANTDKVDESLKEESSTVEKEVLPTQSITSPEEQSLFKDEDADEEGFEFPKVGAGIKFGTLGLGLDIAVKINEKFNVRLNLNKLELDFDEETTHTDKSTGKPVKELLEGTVDLASTGVLLDYHPFAGGFRLSLGLYSSSNGGVGSVTGSINDVELGNREYDIVGKGVIDADAGGTQPFLGLGWGNTPRSGFPLSVSLDIGVLLNIDPEVSAEVSGTATDTANGTEFDLSDESNPLTQTFRDDLQAQIDEANDDLSKVSAYPVISIGVNYRFN